jgi:hypothetical protein
MEGLGFDVIGCRMEVEFGNRGRKKILHQTVQKGAVNREAIKKQNGWEVVGNTGTNEGTIGIPEVKEMKETASVCSHKMQNLPPSNRGTNTNSEYELMLSFSCQI